MQQCRKSENCDALVLGSLIQRLKPLGLFPVPLPHAPTMSVKELSSFFRGLEFRTLCQLTDSFATYERCGGLNKILQDIAPQLEPSFFGTGGVGGLIIKYFSRTNPPGLP
jgi:hypothetical protein